jgi:hypothetical protein
LGLSSDKPKGSELYHANKRHNREEHTTGKPTYWPTDRNKIPDLIYFFVFRNVSSTFMDVNEEFDPDSDHSPIVLTFSETVIEKKNKIQLSRKKKLTGASSKKNWKTESV